MARAHLFLVSLLCLALLCSATPFEVRQADSPASTADASDESTPGTTQPPSSAGSTQPPSSASSNPTGAPSSGSGSPSSTSEEGDSETPAATSSGSSASSDSPPKGPEVASDTPEPDDDKACFPADATVVLESGETVSMAELKIGDRVQVAEGRFSPVFMFTHKMATNPRLFVSITTLSGTVLRVSPGHYIYVNNQLALADTVHLGDSIELASGNPDVVKHVQYVKSSGLYNPQTVSGDIVVDGIRASTYTKAVEPELAHAVLAPVKILYKVFGWYSVAFEKGSELASLLPSGAAYA